MLQGFRLFAEPDLQNDTADQSRGSSSIGKGGGVKHMCHAPAQVYMSYNPMQQSNVDVSQSVT